MTGDQLWKHVIRCAVREHPTRIGVQRWYYIYHSTRNGNEYLAQWAVIYSSAILCSADNTQNVACGYLSPVPFFMIQLARQALCSQESDVLQNK